MLLRGDQAFVVLARKLRVDRQPDRRIVLAAAGQADRAVDGLAAAGLGRDLPRKLLGGEDLFEDAFELYFAPATACLDVAEHALEIADTIGERLHFAEPISAERRVGTESVRTCSSRWTPNH